MTAGRQPEQPQVGNPYWEHVRSRIRRDGVWDSFEVSNDRPRLDRRAIVTRYSWAIPSPDAINFILRHTAGRVIFEVGAGTGYWARQLTAAGASVMAFDIAPPPKPNIWHPEQSLWHPVAEAPATVAAEADPGWALMLCWPPYNEPMAAEALTAFPGSLLIYIGEGPGGCTGDDEFHDLLGRDWRLLDDCDQHVRWFGLFDRLEVYQRIAAVPDSDPADG